MRRGGAGHREALILCQRPWWCVAAVGIMQCTHVFRSLIMSGMWHSCRYKIIRQNVFICLLPGSFVYRSATVVWYLLVLSIRSILLLFVQVFWRRGFWTFCKTMEMWLLEHLKALMTSLQMIRRQINNVLNSKNMYCPELWTRWNTSHHQH